MVKSMSWKELEETAGTRRKHLLRRATKRRGGSGRRRA